MERRPLEITVVSGKGLKDVNLIGKMDVYCVVSIKGDPHKSKQKQKTNVHQDCGPNPVWNFPMKFTIDEAAAQQNRLQIKFKLLAERMMGDKDVGVVSVPVKELLDSKDGKGGVVSYAVKTASGKMKGTLNFSYNLGEKFSAPAPEKAKKMDEHVAGANTSKGYHEPVTAYPAMGYQGGPGSSSAISLFEIMENSESYQPNSETYDNFVAGFSNLRDVNKMQAWFVGKRAAGFSANLQNYECLISGCVKTRDFDTADKLFEEMMSLGIMPSLHIMEWVLEGHCKRGSCDQVKEFLIFLLECKFEINGNMIENVVRLYSDLGKVDEMEMLLEIFMEFNQVGEALLQLHCGIIRFYAIKDRLDDVEFSVGRMMSQGMSFKSPSDVEKVISSYFRQGAYERLDLFLEHIKSYFKLTRSTYDLLVAGYRRVGLMEKLNLVMEEMILAGL